MCQECDSNLNYVEIDEVDWDNVRPSLDPEIEDAVAFLQAVCFNDASRAGWHKDLGKDQHFTDSEQWSRFPLRIALMHSELSEALEAHRKNLRDDKLPEHHGITVELADAVIRILDTATAMRLPLAEALVAKLAINRTRTDHTIEARQAAGGKEY